MKRVQVILAILLGLAPFVMADTEVTLTTDNTFPTSYTAAPGQIYSATFVASVTTGIHYTETITIPGQRYTGMAVQLWTASATSGTITNASLEIQFGATDDVVAPAPAFTLVNKYDSNSLDWFAVPVVDDLGTFFVPADAFRGARTVRLRFHRNNNSTAYGFSVSFKD